MSEILGATLRRLQVEELRVGRDFIFCDYSKWLGSSSVSPRCRDLIAFRLCPVYATLGLKNDAKKRQRNSNESEAMRTKQITKKEVIARLVEFFQSTDTDDEDDVRDIKRILAEWRAMSASEAVAEASSVFGW